MDTIQFGHHLTLDFYGCDTKALDDENVCYRALAELPKKLGMHALLQPQVLPADSNVERGGKDPGGFSGFVMIAESHISLHTFVKRRFASMDIYSCKKFDNEMAIAYFKKIFKPKDIEINFINRGMRYPAMDLR